MKRRCATILFVGIISIAVAISAYGQKNKDFLIVPSKQIGPVKLGMQYSQLTALLGNGEAEGGTGSSIAFWPQNVKTKMPSAHYFSIMFFTDLENPKRQIIAQIRITSSKYSTEKGISTHSSLKDIWRAYPNIKWYTSHEEDPLGTLDIYCDDELGIAFEITRQSNVASRCYGVIVYHRGNGSRGGPREFHFVRRPTEICLFAFWPMANQLNNVQNFGEGGGVVGLIISVVADP